MSRELSDKYIPTRAYIFAADSTNATRLSQQNEKIYQVISIGMLVGAGAVCYLGVMLLKVWS